MGENLEEQGKEKERKLKDEDNHMTISTIALLLLQNCLSKLFKKNTLTVSDV